MASEAAASGPDGWHRVFGSTLVEPTPAGLVEILHGLVPADAQFGGDEAGWFHAEFRLDGLPPLEIERFLATEKGLRAELNSWAAWVETQEHFPARQALMERFIQTQQLFTLRGGEERLRLAAARYLAQVTEGLYQVDGVGLFLADGTLLLAEDT